jgi:sugar/nucleoside kinase (ribokinase family)
MKLFLVVGDVFADLSATVRRFPFEGDDSQFDQLTWGSGGSAANVATALAHLGAPVRLLARVGPDPAAQVALRAAQNAGVDLAAVQSDPLVATGLCFAVVSPGGERTFFSFRGANVEFELDSAAALEDVGWLHLSGYALLDGTQRTTAEALIELAEAAGLPISLDLCLPLLRTHQADIVRLIPRLRILFANELELAALAPNTAPLDALEQLVARGTTVAVGKLGHHGCAVVDQAERLALPAFDVAAIDTNGCGDAFVAGFLRAYTGGSPLRTCARLGNALGALTATRRGSADALPDRARLETFLLTADE